jgi:hypothetical protein
VAAVKGLPVVIGATLLAVGTVASGAPTEAPLVVRTSIPSDVQFGDRVVVHVAVLMDPDAVDTDGLRVTAPIAPLTQVAPARISRFSRGGVDVETLELTAACLDQQCVAPRGTRPVQLPPVQAETPTRSGATITATRSWPQLTVHGRVRTDDVARSPLPFTAELDPPPVTYSIAPSTLEGVLAFGAVVLALVGAALALRHGIRIARRRRVVSRTELERALALAQSSETRSPEDRRRALGLLAQLLRSREEQLAPATSSLAWSAPEPTPDSISTLVERVGREVTP